MGYEPTRDELIKACGGQTALWPSHPVDQFLVLANGYRRLISERGAGRGSDE